MAIVATTLSAAIGTGDTQFAVASATNITAPNFTTGAGITYLFIDQEYMIVLAISGTTVQVARGVLGTAAQAHVINAQVLSGLPADFTQFTEFVNASLTGSESTGRLSWPATFLSGATDAVSAVNPGFYVVKTAGVNAMTIATPTAAAEGNLIYISSDTANAHTLTAATACFSNGTAATTVVVFKAFKGSNLWLRVCNLTYHVISSNVTSFT
jgi:hypothetical protein